MPQSTSLDLAKRGEPQAIAALINQSLQPKGIKVKAMLAGECLTLLAESREKVEKDALVSIIRKGIDGLETPAIQRVVIQMREVGKTTLAWREAFDIELPRMLEKPVANSTKNNVEASQVIKTHPRLSESNKFLSYVKEFGTPSLLATILIVLFSNRYVGSQPPAKPTIWEYQVVGVEDLKFDLDMQRLGADGWEVVSARRAIDHNISGEKDLYELILKRPVSEGQAAENVRKAENQFKESVGKSTLSLINSNQKQEHIFKHAFAAKLADLDILYIDNDAYAFKVVVHSNGSLIG